MLNYILMLLQTLCLAFWIYFFSFNLCRRIVTPSQRENSKEKQKKTPKDAVKDEVNKRLISSIIFRKVI